MNYDEEIKGFEWLSNEWGNHKNMLLTFHINSVLIGDAGYDVFDVYEWNGKLEEGQAICRRLAAAMNYCRGMTIEDLEASTQSLLDSAEQCASLMAERNKLQLAFDERVRVIEMQLQDKALLAKQRDKLLETLKHFVRWHDQLNDADIAAAKAIIANAESGS